MFAYRSLRRLEAVGQLKGLGGGFFCGSDTPGGVHRWQALRVRLLLDELGVAEFGGILAGLDLRIGGLTQLFSKRRHVHLGLGADSV